jgi:hypothetical protein
MGASRQSPPIAAACALAFLLAAGCAGLLESPAAFHLAVTAPDLDASMQDFFPQGEDPADPVGRALFEQINRERRDAGLAPVLWDERAARLAREYSARQIRDRTYGHFLTEGTPPYARVSFAGILGVSSENTVAVTTTGLGFSDDKARLALEGHRRMMEEKPPEDGHRKTVLDPDATHVGVGAALSGGEFRLDEEFVSRRFAWLRVTRAAGGGASVRVRGQAAPDTPLEFVTAACEPLPAELTRQEAISRRSYSYPSPRAGLMPYGDTGYLSFSTSHSIVLSTRGRFSFSFLMERPGLWTFVLYFRKPGDRHPVPGGSFTVRVGEAAAY